MTIYYCKGCNRCLNLSDEYLFPPNAYFDAGNKGTLSFSAVDKTDFRQKEDNSCFPFFETLDSWGLQRHRTKLTCAACGKRLGYIYYDGPYAEGGIGQYGLGHTQMIPRHPRYRLKREAMRISG
ncbi:uncharacterized protein At4g08330, chloroplastic [Physcomitrium patens]|uniref:Uncharacterized protein n=1 Tax=Physcomitrium patens TaxID=3218 RepID=A0A2K1J3I1_PHYPA|nr:uncharacterized protein At4g08330, chloroplastic-like [Physcomitrium patens]PNR36089.1 hypothetical protein PHYPA_021939 [Physcomitrium patens]|eukprot:XP_024400029.1 uncharacterized protein At4g08330, chloroplastic-like [Physcomitrella patens]